MAGPGDVPWLRRPLDGLARHDRGRGLRFVSSRRAAADLRLHGAIPASVMLFASAGRGFVDRRPLPRSTSMVSPAATAPSVMILR